MELDLDTTTKFLQTLRPGGPWNLTSITPDGPIASATLRDAEQARAWLSKHARTNLYFAANPCSKPTGRGGRGNKAGLDEIQYVHVDIDVDKLTDTQSLDDRKVAALERLEAADSAPTLVSDSGGGLQALWRLEAPLPPTPENIDQVEGMNRWAVEQYGGDPGTTDVSRLLRLPGTTNFPDARKRARGRVVAPTKLLRSTREAFDLWHFGHVPAPPKAAVDVEFGAPEEVDLDALGLDDRLMTILRDGRLDTPKEGDDSRSAWLFDATCQLLRADVVPEQVLWLLLDPELGISASILDKRSTPEEQLAYAERQVRNGLAIVRAEQRGDVEGLLGDAKEPATSRPKRFKRYSITELLDLPDPVWTVDRLLMEGSFGMLYGSPKTFKTFICLALGLCIATGRPFYGHPVIRGTVTYVAAEGNPGETRNRVLAWCRANGVEPSELDGWFKLVTTGAHLDRDEMVREFIAADPEPCDVTFIDTVNRSMAGDESGTKDMTAFVAGCDKVRRELKTAVIAVHHSGVNSERERGSTVLRAAVDTRFRVTQKQGVVTLEVEDQRAGPSGEKIYLRPVTIPVRDFDGPESVVMEQTAAPASKGHQDQGSTEQKMSADDVMLIRISQEKPGRYLDLVSDTLAGFSKANVHKVKGRLITAKLVKASDRPTLTKGGAERVERLLEPETEGISSR